MWTKQLAEQLEAAADHIERDEPLQTDQVTAFETLAGSCPTDCPADEPVAISRFRRPLALL